MRYGDIAKELYGIAHELTDLAERLNKSEAAIPAIRVPDKTLESSPAEFAQPPKAMLSVEEAGELLGISRQLAYQLANRDDFPCLRIGRRMLIPRNKLLEWVDNHCGQEVIL